MGLFGGLRIIPFIPHISLVLLKTKDRTSLPADKCKSEKWSQHTGSSVFLQQCLWSTAMYFLQPLYHFKGHFCLHTLPCDEEKAHLGKHSGASGIPEKLLEDHCWGWTQPDYTAWPRATVLCFPFLNLGKKTFPPLLSSHFERTQRNNNKNRKDVFSHIVFCYWRVKPLSQEMSAIQRWRLMISGQKWSFRQNFPAGPGCFHHAYLHCQARPRLRSWLRAPSPIVLHILLPHIYQPRFHRPYCLPLNSLTSFNPEFTQLLKLCVPDKTVGKVLQQIPLFLPAACPSIRGLCSKHKTYQGSWDLPLFFHHHILAGICACLPAQGDGEQHSSGKHSSPCWVTSVPLKPLPPPFSPAGKLLMVRKERMCTVPKGLQKQTELPPKEASGSHWGFSLRSYFCLFWLPPLPSAPRKSSTFHL